MNNKKRKKITKFDFSATCFLTPMYSEVRHESEFHWSMTLQAYVFQGDFVKSLAVLCLVCGFVAVLAVILLINTSLW